MNANRPRPLSWVLPACAAVVVICGFSLVLHMPWGKQPAAQSASPSGAGASATAVAKTSPLDLVGVVKSVDGQAVSNASVFIYTAQPRSGPGFL